MFQNPKILEWLGGIEPAWTLLEPRTLMALRQPPSPVFGPIRLAADLTEEEHRLSVVTTNTLILQRAASAGPGSMLTATGNLARAVVADMADRFDWPDFDKAAMRRYFKALNEPDFLPLYFVRHLAETAKLIRRHKGHFRTTPAGRKLLEESNIQTAQAVLFHTAFWYADLGYFGMKVLAGWPYRDAGIVLWSLSVAADDWQSPEHLTRSCTIPVDDLFFRTSDTGTHAMSARILRPLTWFGLLEERTDPIEPGKFLARHFYRKSPLFDRFLSFDVKLMASDASRH